MHYRTALEAYVILLTDVIPTNLINFKNKKTPN